MVLDSRLRSVVNEIDGSDCTIDVGSDHGKVILTALMENRTKKGIASDISRDSLSKAESLALRLGIALDTRCGDGLSVVSDGEVDTCVIAGMGGKEIVKILGAYDGQIAKLILVPHRDARLTRRFLVDNNYFIDKDYMIFEGNFYYNIIVARVGKGELSETEEYFGKNTKDNKVFASYIEYRKGVLNDILSKTDNADMKHELELLERY